MLTKTYRIREMQIQSHIYITMRSTNIHQNGQKECAEAWEWRANQETVCMTATVNSTPRYTSLVKMTCIH